MPGKLVPLANRNLAGKKSARRRRTSAFDQNSRWDTILRRIRTILVHMTAIRNSLTSEMTDGMNWYPCILYATCSQEPIVQFHTVRFSVTRAAFPLSLGSSSHGRALSMSGPIHVDPRCIIYPTYLPTRSPFAPGSKSFNGLIASFVPVIPKVLFKGTGRLENVLAQLIVIYSGFPEITAVQQLFVSSPKPFRLSLRLSKRSDKVSCSTTLLD